MAKRKTVMASSEEKSAAMTGFFRGTKMEMKKVIWPTKQQMIQYLIAVIVSIVLVSFLIVVVDFAFMALSKFLISSLG